MPERPIAVLDANVLYPFELRGFLLFLAAEDLFEPLWSGEIVDEFSRHLLANGVMTREQLARMVGQMRRYFPEAWGTGYAGKADGLELPDEDDRHVVALAIHYEAEYIVTRNGGDFPRAVLAPCGVEPVTPGRFVDVLCEAGFEAIFRAAEEHRCSHTRDPLSATDYLEALRRRADLPTVATRLAAADFTERARPCGSLTETSI